MANDSDIEFLKKKKLLEMKRMLLLKKAQNIKDSEKEKIENKKKIELTSKDLLKKIFIGRAWEVWNTAEKQYPSYTKEVADTLASLIKSGRLNEKINGEQLYWFLRRIGIRVKLDTKIRIYESGELRTIADKLKGK